MYVYTYIFLFTVPFDALRCGVLTFIKHHIGAFKPEMSIILADSHDMQHYYHARYPSDDWHLAYMFWLVYLSVEVCPEGVFPHSVSTRRDHCVRVYASLTLAPPPREKNKKTRGDPALHLPQARGHLNLRMGLLLQFVISGVIGVVAGKMNTKAWVRKNDNKLRIFYSLLGGNLGCWIIQLPLILHNLWGMPWVDCIMALRSYSILDILLSSIIIIAQNSSQALNKYKCV